MTTDAPLHPHLVLGVVKFVPLGNWDLVAVTGEPLLQTNWHGDWMVRVLANRHVANLTDGVDLLGVASGVTSLWASMGLL